MTTLPAIPHLSVEEFSQLDPAIQRLHCLRLLHMVPDSALVSIFDDLQMDYEDTLRPKAEPSPEPESRIVEAKFMGRVPYQHPDTIELD